VWTRGKKKTGSVAAAISPGLRVYAIGDVHGCASLLSRLAERIAADLSTSPIPTAQAVFLGDYIDRGPASAAILSRLSQRDFPVPFVALRGNHEQMLLRFLDEPQYLDSWRQFGGLETLHSFGISVSNQLDTASYDVARERLARSITSEVRQFIDETVSHHEIGDYYFCHAGVRPGTPLDAQRDQDLLWIRDDFLSSTADYGKIIVHGHTPVEAPEFHPNRINIDTGAYLTGVLTCLVLEGTTRRLLTS
jgi:serine/threonine protein phosphatase 1